MPYGLLSMVIPTHVAPIARVDTCRLLAVLLARDQHTTNPLIIALFLEFVHRHLRRTPSINAHLERSEYARRDRDIFWYLLRGSIWKEWTRYVLSSKFVHIASQHCILPSASCPFSSPTSTLLLPCERDRSDNVTRILILFA